MNFVPIIIIMSIIMIVDFVAILCQSGTKGFKVSYLPP